MAIRDRILRRARPVTPSHGRVTHPVSPLWVRAFTAGGRPLIAIVVLGMCAPGEHHLAVLAGWDKRLAWGMAAVLAAYAGIAAAVASNRPKGAAGKRSAVAGAFLSLGAAMAAQPVSHMFVTGHLSSEPRTPLWLVIAVSCVPPLVLGHLLHLAATPVPAAVDETDEQPAEQAELSRTDAEQPVRDVPSLPAATEQPAPWFAGRPEQRPPLTAETGEQAEAATPEQHEQPERDRFLTSREVADRYGVELSTVGTWKQRGKIRPALVDPRVGNLYDPETLPAAASTG